MKPPPSGLAVRGDGSAGFGSGTSLRPCSETFLRPCIEGETVIEPHERQLDWSHQG